MEHFKITKSSDGYIIGRVNSSPSLFRPMEKRIIEICIDILFNWGRHKSIGFKFYALENKGKDIDLSEYELIKIIDIFLKQEWNLKTGRFFKDYYFDSYPQAKEELKILFPNGI